MADIKKPAPLSTEPKPTPEPSAKSEILAPVEPATPPPVKPVPAPPGNAPSFNDDVGLPHSEPIIVSQVKAKRRLQLFILAILAISVAVVAALILDRQKAAAPSVGKTQPQLIDKLSVGVVKADLSKLSPGVEDNGIVFDIANQLYEPLVRYDDPANLAPALASNWKSTDDHTWQFTLNSNAKFSNNQAVTTADIKTSLEDDAAAVSSLGVYAQNFASISVVDASTVQIKTKVADPMLPQKLTQFLIYDTKDKVAVGSLPLGSGPYVLRPKTQLTANYVQLLGLDYWYGGRIYTKAVDFRAFDTSAELQAALKDGTVNIASSKDAQLSTAPSSALTIDQESYFVPIGTTVRRTTTQGQLGYQFWKIYQK